MTRPPHPRWVVLFALSMVALNLRIALSSIPPVVEDIQALTGWSDATIGTLSTIPILCMGGFAVVVPRIARRIGRQRTVALALALIAVSLVSRAGAEAFPLVLFVSAIGAGVGIALASGLVPGVVREQLPDAVGAATGLWTSVMMIGAALGGALTVPLAIWLGSWPLALALWAIPALIGLAVWAAVEGLRRSPTDAAGTAVRVRDLPWRDRRAWSLTLYLTFNSIVFYTALAWLAPAYVDRGWSQESAGWLLGLFTASQVVAALVLPPLVERLPGRRAVYAVLVLVCAGTVLWIGWAPAVGTVLAVVLLGTALGGSFAVGLALLSEFTEDAAASARLTGMAFAVTYLTAALGPLTAGILMDSFDSWPLVYGLLAVVCLAQLATIPALRRGVRIG